MFSIQILLGIQNEAHGMKSKIITFARPKVVAKAHGMKVATTIAERIVQRKGSAVPPVSGFMSKHALGAKSGSVFERLAAMKNRNVDSGAKVSPGPIPYSTATDSSVEKGKSTLISSCERPIESEAGEFPEICALLKADLLEDVNVYAKFVDSVGKVVVRSDYFAKHPAYWRRSSLIDIMHKTLILAAESMRIDQDAIEFAKEAEMALTAQLCSAGEKIEKLEYELTILKGSNVSASTYAVGDRLSGGRPFEG